MSMSDLTECACPAHAIQERPKIDDDCPIHGVNAAFVMCEHGYGWNGASCDSCHPIDVRTAAFWGFDV